MADNWNEKRYAFRAGKYPVDAGIVSQSFSACSINFCKPISCRTEHAQKGPDRRHEGKMMQFPFSSSLDVKPRRLPNRPLSTRTVFNRLRASGYRAGRSVKRLMLTSGQKAARLDWCQQRRNLNIWSWKKLQSSDESRFLVHMMDGRVPVSRQQNTGHPWSCSFRWRLNIDLRICMAWL